MNEWFCCDCGAFSDDSAMIRKTELIGESPQTPIVNVYCPLCLGQRIEPEPSVKDVAETARRINLEGGRSKDEYKRSLAWMTVAECLDFIVEVS